MKIVVTLWFAKQLRQLNKKYPSIAKDYEELLVELDKNPTLGTPLGRDCYKIRIAISAKNRGKSGGGRVISCVKIQDGNIFLLDIYDKSEKDSISDKRILELLEQIKI